MEEVPKPAPLPRCCIGLTYNLKKGVDSDAEAEYDSIDTVLAIKKVLEEDGCKVELLEADAYLPEKLQKSKVDIVFNIAEGIYGRGREAQVPAILNFYKIPFTGSDETTLCIALDKALAKRVLSTYGIRTPKYMVIADEKQCEGLDFSFPVIVKPNAEGSSKGIAETAIVNNEQELRALIAEDLAKYKEAMLAEEYVAGREFTVGMFGNGKDLHVFPPMEIVFINDEERYNIYSYPVKQNYKKYVRYECPASISKEVEQEMIRMSKEIYEALECKDVARIDFRLSKDGKVYFIEINPLPGMAPGYSDFPMIAQFCGMGYAALVRNILSSARKRYDLGSLLS